LVTLQTLPGEEIDRTERAPAVLPDDEPELDLSIDVELEPELQPEMEADDDAVTPARAAAALQPLVDPEPSRMPDVLTAMVELHTGIDADEAPTRLRDVVTELWTGEPAATPAELALTPSVAPADIDVALTPAPAPALALTPAPAPALVFTPAPVISLAITPAPAVALTPAPEVVEDAWLTTSSLSGVSSAPIIFQSELAAPEVHEALTWNPGPVALSATPAVLPPALVIAEPLPEPSPYAPAVLPSRTSEVSELLDSFHVSDAAEERDLRSALKEMAGLELTPMPHPYVEEG
jgi:hypothetical protein